MFDKFLVNASRAWTNAKVQIKSNFESMADDTGIKKLNISDEYDKADQIYEDIMNKAKNANRAFNQLTSSIQDNLNSLIELACILVDSFLQEEVEEYNKALALHQKALQIKAVISHSTLIEIQNLNNSYVRLSSDGRNISSIRNNVKSNFSKYMNYSQELDKKTLEQKSYITIFEVEKKMNEHDKIFKQSLSLFLSEVKRFQKQYSMVSQNVFVKFECLYSGFLKTISSILSQQFEIKTQAIYEEDEDENIFIEVDTDCLN